MGTELYAVAGEITSFVVRPSSTHHILTINCLNITMKVAVFALLAS
jgi:hypothetical protein